jgi:hypothetical protein
VPIAIAFFAGGMLITRRLRQRAAVDGSTQLRPMKGDRSRRRTRAYLSMIVTIQTSASDVVESPTASTAPVVPGKHVDEHPRTG